MVVITNSLRSNFFVLLNCERDPSVRLDCLYISIITVVITLITLLPIHHHDKSRRDRLTPADPVPVLVHIFMLTV